ncbi:hypothetical protein IFM89_023023 [Coptis chinensis]|uniref:Protein kinase domain-containing protein n=1 Tax=Coptis chinensis TaxID=261450 RepID=A0A835IFC3_9MAGN|nr:hypothetical protein IFM89_023023 [Coptis chinensis]
MLNMPNLIAYVDALRVLGFVIGGVTMYYLDEEPIHITENLNFDYTKSVISIIMSCPSVSCGLNCKENIELEKYVGSRVIAPNQNLNLVISLKLPESDYNQKLGDSSFAIEKKRMGIMFQENQYWRRGKMLGHGSFGMVHLAYTNPTKKTSGFQPVMAVKSTAYAEAEALMKESDILMELQGSPYIIGHYSDDDNVKNGHAYFNVFLEYASLGTLGDRIRERYSDFGVGLPEAEVKYFTPMILKGLKYIHEHQYVHRDIKPDNILLVSSSSGSSLTDIVPKIADFGLAERLDKEVKKDDEPLFLTGTAPYMAPESICRNEYKPHSDIWTLGIVVLEMLTREDAWSFDVEYDSEDSLMSRIGYSDELPSIPSSLSTEAHPFLAVDNKKDGAEEKSRGKAEQGVILSPRTPLQPKWWISISSTDATYRVAASTDDLKLKDEKKRKITDEIKEDNNEKEVVEEVTKGEAALGEVLRPRTPLVPKDWWLSFGSLHAIYRPKAASKDAQFEVGKRRRVANEVKEGGLGGNNGVAATGAETGRSGSNAVKEDWENRERMLVEGQAIWLHSITEVLCCLPLLALSMLWYHVKPSCATTFFPMYSAVEDLKVELEVIQMKVRNFEFAGLSLNVLSHELVLTKELGVEFAYKVVCRGVVSDV